MSRCCWYTNNKLYISGARIPYHFCFSLLSCFNNGKYFDILSYLLYNCGKFELLGDGKCLPIFWEYLRIFLIVSRFSIFVFWWLVFVINVFSSWQLTRLDLTGTFFELENSEPLMFRLYFCCAGNHRRSVWGKHCWWVAENCDETAVRCSLGVDLSSFVFVALK